MMMKKKQFIQMLEDHPELKKDLFIRGFLITDHEIGSLDGFPFYSNWTMEKNNGFYFMAHKLTGMYVYTDPSERCFFIMGHAYDPFTMQSDENEILKKLSEACEKGNYIEKVNDLTGVFVLGKIENGEISFLVDPSGMQSAFYGQVGDRFYLSSHAQLIGDVCRLKRDPFIKELTSYKWYGRVMGPYLPADLSPFNEVKRVVPSISYRYKSSFEGVAHERYWPVSEVKEAADPDDYANVIREAAELLKKNMALVSEKWQHPWISLTGGIDSNTTFASANGLYDRFETFSYISAEKEIQDAEAAKRIADHFRVKHHEYHIPDRNADLDLFDERRELFRHNNGYVAELYDNEARKKFYLRDHAECDVEVKSWVSETIRAYWYKHYGRKSMPPLSPKLFRNLYKIFTTDRKLAHKIDRIFEKYIDEFEYRSIPEGYPPADMHYNEVTWGSWGGLNITEMKYCFDITFIYNNRRFFDLMFRVPLEKRITDQHHLDMKKYLNPELSDMNIRIVNMKETDFRAFALNVIFSLNSVLPF